MINASEAGAKYTKNSFKSFLEGEQDEKWVMGVIGASNSEDITKALESLSVYSNNERFEVLKRLCGKSQ